MDYRNAFKVVSTGKRVSSLYAEPELTIYPDTNRMRITKKGFDILGIDVNTEIVGTEEEQEELKNSLRLMVLQSDSFIAFIKDDSGKCKADKNGNFTSSAVVTPLELDANTSYKEFETAMASDLGLEDYDGETPVLIFNLENADTEDVADDDDNDSPETETTEAE